MNLVRYILWQVPERKLRWLIYSDTSSEVWVDSGVGVYEAVLRIVPRLDGRYRSVGCTGASTMVFIFRYGPVPEKAYYKRSCEQSPQGVTNGSRSK